VVGNPNLLVGNPNLLVGNRSLLVANRDLLVGNRSLLVVNRDFFGRNPFGRNNFGPKSYLLVGSGFGVHDSKIKWLPNDVYFAIYQKSIKNPPDIRKLSN
jgi:hypothetical protein